jgi:glycerophosphoryl diester phosphodiesterase
VQIIAHRGTPRHHPENTLAGFAQALADGADAIELDVRRTADDVVVVHHDAASPGSPPIDTLPATALLHTIPTLAAVLALVDGRATVYVEVKQPGIESDVVGVLAGSSTPAAVHAFDHRVASRVTALSPGTPTGVLMSSYVIDPVAVLRAAGARDWWQEWPMIDAALVTAIHGAGGRVIAWTVNDPQVAARLATLGVDGICTDVPGLIREHA